MRMHFLAVTTAFAYHSYAITVSIQEYRRTTPNKKIKSAKALDALPKRNPKPTQ